MPSDAPDETSPTLPSLPMAASLAPLMAGVAAKRLTAEQEAILSAPLDPAQLRIEPSGNVYLPHIFVNMRLNKAFGLGGWGLLPLGKPEVVDRVAVWHFALIIEGRFVSDAVGGMRYLSGNARMTYDDCIEGAKSIALRRLGKYLGIGLELWDSDYTSAWRSKFATRVWRRMDGKWHWRRRDDQPWSDEGDPRKSSESPYRKPQRLEDEWEAMNAEWSGKAKIPDDLD